MKDAYKAVVACVGRGDMVGLARLSEHLINRIEALEKSIVQAAKLTDEIYEGPDTHKGRQTLFNCMAANRILRDALKDPERK